ncbi:MAG: nucleoside deaminase [bacterium]|nr:nucleoside deaminase [bacterium]
MQTARDAAAFGEVPVAAMICEIDAASGEWRELACSRNRIVELSDPTAHAEMLALRAACEAQKSERLKDAALIVSLEPCMMCTGALVLARVNRIYYFAPTEKGAGMAELLEATRDNAYRVNHYPEFVALDEYREECAGLLRDFFRERRSK